MRCHSVGCGTASRDRARIVFDCRMANDSAKDVIGDSCTLYSTRRSVIPCRLGLSAFLLGVSHVHPLIHRSVQRDWPDILDIPRRSDSGWNAAYILVRSLDWPR